MVLKSLSDEDRARARAKALASRTRRAEVKSAFGAGRLGIEEVLGLGAAEEAVGRLRVADLLEAVPGVGRIRAAALMERLGISPNRRLRGLGRKQQDALRRHFAAPRGSEKG
ncbi:integration host factor, actinobacterial type [Zafaria sp. Z1313]|uniref:integration host factor, actinobacterial type n=1 Tax=unclassified Zafaria TaxID=2828765 RepID=UPI002E791D36|nr:integration host factor, actinobacterial type [Zafaria sp. J156]MEE1621135.1 integration host factor, actinobacterial type [Zafaria sp. J156]